MAAPFLGDRACILKTLVTQRAVINGTPRPLRGEQAFEAWGWFLAPYCATRGGRNRVESWLSRDEDNLM
ncbi:hypothetical protein RN01_31815 [Cupriavidus sp. SHE]|jgi:hypothetical protein|uniref:Uncharacterized protein n=2 Tax=Cupriavidus metallidurans TaxID=119219 RepID=A0A482J3Q6_9BURK|nr:hypothetical protein [Cupriavidus sp. SHE]KWR71462.1 hypothetical protein RN01_31815 [Cupriavidus sp. SHE]QBP14247.1 hypothetical protein DDF84_029995 [Cupriavidus metallidurans]